MFKDYAENIRRWAKDRKIIPNSSLEAQNTKLAEEFRELALAIRKDDKNLTIDSIGDIFVVVTIMAGLDNGNIEDMELLQNEYYENKDNLKYSFMWLQSDIGDIAKSIIRDNKIKRFESYVNAVNDLNALCEYLKLDFIECISKAWNEIKDRKGYLNEEGIFIKEEDL
jgi:NTP pyrophosphatase (non-canonical NTP hydrolase)